MNPNKFILTLMLPVLIALKVNAQGPGHKSYISDLNQAGYFPLSSGSSPASIYTDDNEYPGVKRAVTSLITDINAVTGKSPALIQQISKGKPIVIIGTLGKNALLDQLVKAHKLNAALLTGKWEKHITTIVKDPFPGVKQALVIAGSDKRGTIYGVYDLSAQIGVSPWYWWADVPVKKQQNLFVVPGTYTDGEPAVKYRGIFINDEAPAFSGWTKEKFGGVNHNVYEKVFELILRLKGNYLWPAMWGNAFNDDDKLNPILADEYGVVMGTSHHEPMDRAQQEWKRYGSGQWNYESNKAVLQDFWRKGIQNMGKKETIVTVGMRGDGDMPMTEGSNIALLENIVKDQRNIISEVTGKDASQTPQMWALYKEVQNYYDKGMRVPDDVTLLLCDDNWGNIRKLPNLNERPRKGGYGIYYHFDYVGGPRNYKWLNTNPISKTWEQMHLAYEYNARQIWIVNVGDLKPMEFPISFFLDYAWSPNSIPSSSLNTYTQQWAAQQFGPRYSKEIARFLTLYTKYNGRRKPELLDENTYSLINYHEFESVAQDYKQLNDEAEKLWLKMPANLKDAYYELVLHPIQACSNLNQMYFEAAKNKLYAAQGRASTNKTADSVTALFKNDKEISNYYNKALANGKWDHMMDQTHIGYTYWQQPPVDKMPVVTNITLPEKAEIGLSVEGSADWWKAGDIVNTMPVLYPSDKMQHSFEIFNRGNVPFKYSVEPSAKYVHIEPQSGIITDQQRVLLNIDYANAPAGISNVTIKVKSDAGDLELKVTIDNSKSIDKMYRETNGYVSIEALHYSRKVNLPKITWVVIPDYGRTADGVIPSPVTALRQHAGGNSPHLEYDVSLRDTGTVSIESYLSPTVNFKGERGLLYAVSVDNEQPQIVDINTIADSKEWNEAVSNNIRKMITRHHIGVAGKHTVKYWMVDPAVVLQKLIVNTGGLKPSYLGAPGQ